MYAFSRAMEKPMKCWRFAPMALVLGGCTVITNETSSQCHSQEDCISRGPEFANTTCAEDRTCQPIKAAVEACTSNKQCADQNGGAPFICRKSDSRCVSLLSTVCQTIYADKVD